MGNRIRRTILRSSSSRVSLNREGSSMSPYRVTFILILFFLRPCLGQQVVVQQGSSGDTRCAERRARFRLSHIFRWMQVSGSHGSRPHRWWTSRSELGAGNIAAYARGEFQNQGHAGPGRDDSNGGDECSDGHFGGQNSPPLISCQRARSHSMRLGAHSTWPVSKLLLRPSCRRLS